MWAVAFTTLAAASAIPDELTVTLVASPLAPLVGQTVRFNATIHQDHADTSGRHLSFRFVFGDGSGTDWQANATASHAYTTPGNYTASVLVRVHEERVGSASVTIRVFPSPPPAPDVRPVLAVLDPMRPAAGTLTNLTVVLLNDGSATATAATVRVTDIRPNGTRGLIGSAALAAPLPATATTPVRVGPLQADGVGNHTLQIRVTDVLPPAGNPSQGVRTLTMTVTAAPPPPVRTGPELRLLAAVLDVSHPVEGEFVNLSVVVWNSGTAVLDRATLYAYDIRPNGSVASLGSVPIAAAVPPSTGTLVTFLPFAASGAGIHTLRILAQNVTPPPLLSGIPEINVTMNVLAATPPSGQGAPPFDFGPLAIGLAGAALVSGVAAVFLLRPRPSAPLEPPPAAPPDHSPPPIWPP